MLLFYFADKEILNISQLEEHVGLETVLSYLDLDLKLLVFILPLDEVIVIVPTHYLESVICRKLISRNLAYVHAGYVRTLLREPSFDEFIEKKRDVYKRVMTIPQYRDAYYRQHDYGISKVGFSMVRKGFSTGWESLSIWTNNIFTRAKTLGYNMQRLQDLVHRINETERESFLWESVKAHLYEMSFSTVDERLLRIRQGMSEAYILAHSRADIQIPCGSGIVWNPLLPCGETGAYNVWRIRRVLELLGIFGNIASFSPSRIVALKTLPWVALALSKLRSLLEENLTAEQAFVRFELSGFAGELKRAVKKSIWSSRPLLNERSIMRHEIVKFKDDYPGETVFVMMTFPKNKKDTKKEDKKLDAIFAGIRDVLQRYGLTAVRADKKVYATSDSQWENLQIYMEAADYGVAVLEDLFHEEINPNVAVEYGYMGGLGKRVLLLKDIGFTKIASDLLGKLWKEFDINDLQTLKPALEQWMVDLDKRKIVGE